MIKYLSINKQEHQQQQHVLTSSSDTDEIEIQDIQNFDDDEYNCEEEVLEDETEQEAETVIIPSY